MIYHNRKIFIQTQNGSGPFYFTCANIPLVFQRDPVSQFEL